MRALLKLQSILKPQKLFQHLKCYTTPSMESRIEVNGQTINYLKTGKGTKTVLCFPGALGTIWSDFKPQIEGLNRDNLTIIAWDPPGYGLSRKPSRNFTIDFYEKDADIAHEFMKELGFKKYSLLGWSDGGISSMIMSAKYPNSIDKLIIWGANSYIVEKEIKAYEAIRDLSKWSDRMKAPLIKLYTEEGLQRMWNGWCDAVTEIYKKNDGNICKELLPKIQSPTLILHGDKDPMVAAEHPEYLLNHIKKSKLHRFPEGKHNIHLKYAQEFNKIVQDFILL